MRYFRALTLSVLLHGIAALLFSILVPNVPLPTRQIVTSPYVDLLETPELQRRPTKPSMSDQTFVRSAKTPQELLTDKQNKKRFASETEQNVLEERQARASGLTANRTGTSEAQREVETPQNSRTRSQSKASKDSVDKRPMAFSPGSPLKRLAEEEAMNDIGDIAVGGLRKRAGESSPMNSGRPLDFSRFGSIERGVSTVGEALPNDIKFGDFTALNTDRHLYYTFYSRIEEMVRPRWVNYAKAVVYGVESGAEQVEGRATWTTKLEVLLDPKGNFVRAILHESSGVRNLDAAPVQAFRDALNFPNPPAEMVKDDGRIHIYYAFSVNIVPRYAGRASDHEGTD